MRQTKQVRSDQCWACLENGDLKRETEITDSLNIEGLLMTVDIEKAFDSINHTFLICVLKKIGFGNDFQKWIQILMKNPQ